MASQEVIVNVRYLDKRIVRRAISASHAVAADGGHSVKTGRLLPNGSITLEADKRLVLNVNYPARATVTLNSGANSEVTTDLTLVGPIVLPGPVRVVLTNTITSPEDGGSITYTAASAS